MNKIETSIYNPTYIIEQDPNRFGGKQEDYLLQSRNAIHQAAIKIRKAKDERRDLQKLFFELLGDLSEKRAKIAQEHGTKKAHLFGVRRNQLIGAVSWIALANVYDETNDQMIRFLHEKVKAMELKGTPGVFEKSRSWEETAMGRVSKLQVEVLTIQDMNDKGWQGKLVVNHLPGYMRSTEDDEALNRYYEIGTLPSPELRQKLEENYKRFKSEKPDEYQLIRIQSALQSLVSSYPSGGGQNPENLKSIFIRATLRMSVSDKLYAFTQYFTWMYENYDWVHKKDPAHHPLERMKRCSKVVILHQDALLIDETLKEIAKIFEKAVLWTRGKDRLEDLKDQMALMLHMLAHNIRDIRGTAAETEWLEMAIYKALDVVCKKESDKLIDLEAFSHPFLSEFKQVYNQLVSLN